MDMVRLEKYQGFSADIAAAGCLLIASLTGIPVSHDTYQKHRDHGCGGSQADQRSQLGHRQGNGMDLDLDIPWMRAHRLFHGTGLHVDILKRKEYNYGRKKE